MMLPPDKVRPGNLSSAKPMSLLMPVGSYDELFLILPDDAGEPTAVFLGNRFSFEAFPARASDNWSGLYVEEVRIELDVTSATRGDWDAPRGSLIRRGSGLYLAVKVTGSGFPQVISLPIAGGLPPADEGSTVAFARWQIVIGEGREKQVLWQHPPEPTPMIA